MGRRSVYQPGGLAERGQQVHKMGQIYRTAQQVICWLGPAGDDSDIAIDVLRRIALEVRRNKDLPISQETGSETSSTEYAWIANIPKLSRANDDAPSVQKVVNAINSLLQRRYWRRLWIVQEVVLAQKAMAICGMENMEMEDIAIFVEENCRSEFLTSTQLHAAAKGIWSVVLHTQPWIIFYYRKLFKELNPQPHVFWHAWTNDSFEASDPRDYVYASLAISNTDITPNYSLSPEQVLSRFGIEWLGWMLDENPPFSLLRKAGLSSWACFEADPTIPS